MQARYLASMSAITLLALAFAPGSGQAQQVTNVFPPYAVAGTEARFTALGNNLPLDRPAALGMKFSFGRPGQCNGANRFQPQTDKAYFFACTLRPDIDGGSMLLQVFDRKRAQQDTRLWKGAIQILPGAPKLDSVTLIGPQQGAQTSVRCNAQRVCLTLVGDVQQGQVAIVEVRGSNLPSSLALKFPGCEARNAPAEPQDMTTRIFMCTAGTAGERSIQVLTAPVDQGGVELMSGPVSVL